MILVVEVGSVRWDDPSSRDGTFLWGWLKTYMDLPYDWGNVDIHSPTIFGSFRDLVPGIDNWIDTHRHT